MVQLINIAEAISSIKRDSQISTTSYERKIPICIFRFNRDSNNDLLIRGFMASKVSSLIEVPELDVG